MITKSGTLGFIDAKAIGVHTIYEVPSNKFAKGKLYYHAVAGSGFATHQFYINGVPISGLIGAANRHDFTIGTDNTLKASSSSTPVGTTAITTVAPSGAVYILGPGDKLQVQVTTNAYNNFIAKFVGYEGDAKTVHGTRVGVLGENSNVTPGTYTLYTVPPGRIAVGHLFCTLLTASPSDGTLAFIVNGLEVARATAEAAFGEKLHTCGIPNTVFAVPSIAGGAGDPDTQTLMHSGVQFKLSENDTIGYVVVGTFASGLLLGITFNNFLRFVGSEYPLP